MAPVRLKGEPSPQWGAFVEENAGGGGELLFGRISYELMAGYWPTPAARDNDPAVAERMNGLLRYEPAA